MADVAPFLANLNSGEFSPRMEGRVDFDRYSNAAKMLRNAVLFPQGGFTRRPGSKFCVEVKDSSDTTKLISFQFNQDDSYMCEHGDEMIRFIRRQAQIMVADTDASVSNGTFDSNITGWDDRSTGSASISHDATNDRLQLTGTSGDIAWAEQDVSIGAAFDEEDHVLRFKVDGYGGGKIEFRVGSSSTDDDILEDVELGVGYHSIGFNPGGNSTVYIQFRNANVPNRNMWIDDVSFIDDNPMEVTSPYTSSELSELRYFQAADVVYLLHPDHMPMRLERRGHTSWSLVEAFYEDGPYLDENENFDETIHQKVINPLFENGLEGWEQETNSDATLKHSADTFVVTVTLTDSETSDLGYIDQQITTDANKVHVIHVLTLEKEGVKITVGSTQGGSNYLNKSGEDVPAGWNSFEFTPTGSTIWVRMRADGSIATDTSDQQTAVGFGGCQIYNEDAHLLEPSSMTGGSDSITTITAHGFTPFASSDVGRLLRLQWPGREPGYGIIVAFNSTSSVDVLVLRRFPSIAPTERWRLGAWCTREGFPTVIGFFDGRAVFANTSGEPNSLWFSQSEDLQNMRLDSFVEGFNTVEDDDAIDKTLNAAQIDPIVWLNGARILAVGTAGGEWVVDSIGAVVTPDDTSAKQHTAIPAASLPHAAINQVTLFTDRSKRELHEFGYSFDDDSFVATDLTIIADHILRSPAQDIVYQRRPYSVVWVRRADGRLASLSYNRQHQVLGWSQSIIGGSFSSGAAVVESIAVIPGAEDSSQDYDSDERDELWMVVKRTIGGQTKRYIEFMEYFYDGPLREDYDTEALWRAAVRTSQADAFYVDCGITYSGSSTTTITGLDHLEGETVKVLAGGKVVADKTVSSGQITVPSAVTKAQVGLGYKHRYESLKLPGGNPSGTGVNKVMAISGVGMVLLDAGTFKVTTVDYDEDGRKQHNLETVGFLRPHEDPDDGPALHTGEWDEDTESAYSGDARIYIEGDAPLPFTVLGIAPQIASGNMRASGRR